MMIGGAKHRL